MKTEEESRRFFERVYKMTDEEAIEIFLRLDEWGKRGVKVAIFNNWERLLKTRMEEMRKWHEN